MQFSIPDTYIMDLFLSHIYRYLECTNGMGATPCPLSFGYSLRFHPCIQVNHNLICSNWYFQFSFSTWLIESNKDVLFFFSFYLSWVRSKLQEKCYATVDWCICQCHIYTERGLLVLLLHSFYHSEESSTFNLIMRSIGTMLGILVLR